ncbi:MAG: hypothetical protein V3S51_00390, partial [Dehalococcoidia bacterium]
MTQYRCVLSPGIAEIRSNTRFMLGGYSLDLIAGGTPEPAETCQICITCLVGSGSRALLSGGDKTGEVTLRRTIRLMGS